MANVVVLDEVRRAVEGADLAFPTDDRKGGRPPEPPAGNDGAPRCPVTALGRLAGVFYFLDVAGEQRSFVARALSNRNEILSLFGGRDDWLRSQFPKRANVKRTNEAGEEVTESVVVDFAINRASAWLMEQCFRAGLYGDHIKIRAPGVWPGDEKAPALHCGDEVLIAGAWHPAGYRTGNNVWALAQPVPHPAVPCEAAIGQQLQDEITTTFKFRQPGGATVVLGLLGTSYFGAAATWRPAGFLLGPAGCGKSTLLEILAACCPLHFFSNDCTKAGLEQALHGRAMPCFLDESEKTGDQRGAQALLDLVLTASGARGTQGHRGGADGRGRRIEVVGSIVMAATGAPDMKETHLGRFTLVHMEKPEGGEDYRGRHKALEAKMRAVAPALWGRALSSWERYQVALAKFREGVLACGCAAREADQMGAVLAGWWILTHEGAPDARGVAEGLNAVPGFIRTVATVAEDSNAARLVRFLMTCAIQLSRSTEREPIGELITDVLACPAGETGGLGPTRRALATHGMRVMRADEIEDSRHRALPRLGPAGVWFNVGATELRRLMDGTEWSGNRLETGLCELATGRRSPVPVRVGSVICRPVWVSLDDLALEEAPANEPGGEMQ